MARSWRCHLSRNLSSHDSEDAEDGGHPASSVHRPRWLKCLRSCRAKTSAKDSEGTETRGFTDRIVEVPVVPERQCQPSAQLLDQVPTTGAKDAKMRKDPNVSPQASQTPSAKTRLTMSSRERQPTKRCQKWKCLKYERESEKAPPDMSESMRAR